MKQQSVYKRDEFEPLSEYNKRLKSLPNGSLSRITSK